MRVDALDDKKCGHCSREHTEILVEAFELGVLWDEYGLVGDVIVSSFFPIFVLFAHINFTALH